MSETRIEKERTNEVVVVGELVEVNTEIKSYREGQETLKGYAIVKSVVEGEEHLHRLNIMTNKITKKGIVSKLFTEQNNLDAYLNRRVKLTGEFNERMFARDGSDEIVTYNQINLKFVETVTDTIADAATFRFGGFVVRPLYELADSDGNVTGYRIEIAQENWNGTRLMVIKFDVDSADTSIASAVESYYTPGETVKIEGILGSIVVETVKTAEVAFGVANEEVIQRTNRTYRITGGFDPFPIDEPTKYDDETIASLIEIYKASKAEEIEKSKQNRIGEGTGTGAAAMNALTSAKPATQPKPNRAVELI